MPASATSCDCISARGYGALKAIPEILADQRPDDVDPRSCARGCSGRRARPRTISRGSRTSTSSRRARSATASRIRCCACGSASIAAPCRPTDDEVAREVQRYALARLPQPVPAPVWAYAGVEATPEDRKSWGIIEIGLRRAQTRLRVLRVEHRQPT